MTVRSLYVGRFSRFVCTILAAAIAMNLPAQSWAQVGNIGGPNSGSGQPPVNPRQVEQLPRTRVGGDTTLLAAPEAGKFDLTYISPQAVVVAAFRPKQILTSPATSLMPVEIASAAGLQYLGNDPADVEQITIFSELPVGGPPNYGIILKFARPFLMKSIPGRLTAHTQPGMLNDEPYLESAHPLLPSIYSPDDTTVVIAPDLMLRRLISPPPGATSGKLIERIRNVPAGDDIYMACDLAAFRPLIALGLSQAKDIPPEAKPYVEMPNLIESAELSINLTHDAVSQLIIHANDDASAEKLVAEVKAAGEMWQDKIVEQMRAEAAKNPALQGPIGDAYLKYLERIRHAQQPSLWHLEQAGSDISLFHFRPGNSPQQQLVMAAVIGILVALLLPAIQAAREAARRNQSMNNMKQLMLSLLNYHDAKKMLPANAIYSADGKPLLSWRVAILPYLDQEALYKEFHLDEPWDSPNNKPLIAKIPAVFVEPSYNVAPGKTPYLAIVGEQCGFDGTDKGLKLQQFTDGTSKTVMLVTANPDRAIEWTKPDDLPFDAKNPMAGLAAGPHPGIWLAAFADGSIHVVNNDTDPQTVKAMFTRNGQEQVQVP
jgi:type II secretory pathway pseudopilin PulG